MTEALYYKPCSTCHNTDCVWVGSEDTHKKCEDYQSLEQEPIEVEATKLQSAYNKGYADGQRALAEHIELCKEEQKQGHWNSMPKYPDIAWCCSECEHFTTMKHNYCPNCGARMESEDDNT